MATKAIKKTTLTREQIKYWLERFNKKSMIPQYLSIGDADYIDMICDQADSAITLAARVEALENTVREANKVCLIERDKYWNVNADEKWSWWDNRADHFAKALAPASAGEEKRGEDGS
jgi:hypothetical protein